MDRPTSVDLDPERALAEANEISRLLTQGAVNPAGLDRRRRRAIMQHNPARFHNLSLEERTNYELLGISFEYGHLMGAPPGCSAPLV